MKEEKKMSLEKKLHQNFVDIIDEFNSDYGTNITNVEYKVKIHVSNKENNASYDQTEYEIKTDMK